MIEPLEFRIAPAVLVVNHHRATYTDVDGDLVTIKVSQGTLNSSVFTSTGGAQEQLQQIDLTQGTGFNGANLKLTVTRVAGGDGLAHLGSIEATGIDLGKVVVPGDLGRITAGESVNSPSGLRSLSVQSMGRLGTDTQPAASATFTPSLGSAIDGALGSLRVRHDFAEANLSVHASSPTDGQIRSIKIGGSLIGGGADGSGSIFSTSQILSVKIGHDLQGGGGASSAVIGASSRMPRIAIAGSMIGGTGENSARLVTDGKIGSVKIGHDFVGGTSSRAGWIEGNRIASISIGGSLIGGSGESSAEIASAGLGIGRVTIGQDLVGGLGENSARIIAGGDLGAVTIGGSLIGGFANEAGEIKSAGRIGPVRIGGDLRGGLGLNTFAGFIYSETTLASVTIAGSLIGGAGVDAGFIYANGDILRAVKIGGDVLGGTGADGGGIYSNGHIPKVSIGGSLAGGSGSSNTGLIQGSTLGQVRIGQDVRGGAGLFSGFITASGDIELIAIGGSLLGGDGPNGAAGEIFGGGDIGLVKIGGDLQGGSTASNTGVIRSNGTLQRVMIGGSVHGGAASQSGVIAASGDIRMLHIGGDLTGSSIGPGMASLDQSGYLESTVGRIARVVIDGSIISGTDNSGAGDLTKNASIRSGSDLGSILVKGDVIGNFSSNGLSPVVISARGQASPVAGLPNVAIAKVVVLGSVERANIFGDYDTSLTQTADGAQISLVKVKGDWIASNLVVGVINLGTDDSPGGTGSAADNVNFGDDHDVFVALGPIGAEIAKVIIGGAVTGTDSIFDHFGFTAVTIGKIKIAGRLLPIDGGGVTEVLTPTGDVTIRGFPES